MGAEVICIPGLNEAATAAAVAGVSKVKEREAGEEEGGGLG